MKNDTNITDGELDHLLFTPVDSDDEEIADWHLLSLEEYRATKDQNANIDLLDTAPSLHDEDEWNEWFYSLNLEEWLEYMLGIYEYLKEDRPEAAVKFDQTFKLWYYRSSYPLVYDQIMSKF